MRPSRRALDELRPIRIERNYIKHAEGSVLIEYGDTRVLCNASVVPGVPRFLKGSNQGWITAEYGMLPRATHSRGAREAAQGKQSGRTQEIQRLIGRALRQCIDLKQLGEYTITLDCDVIQADGGTRTAAITGACIALKDALDSMVSKRLLAVCPAFQRVAAVSVGVYQKEPVLDLDYDEDSKADSDMNVVMNDQGGFVEVQGTAEGSTFEAEELTQLLHLAKKGIEDIFHSQKKLLNEV